MSSILKVEGLAVTNSSIQERSKKACMSAGKLSEFELSDR